MKKILLKSLMIGIAGLAINGCTYKTATISYNDFKNLHNNNVKYQKIRPIYACSSGFIWENCSKLARDTVLRLQDQAKALGGDGIINIKWSYKDSFVLTPTCKEQNAWFALYILGGLGPWVQTACAEAEAVKFSDKHIKSKE